MTELNNIRRHFLLECKKNNVKDNELYICLLDMVADHENWQHKVVGLSEDIISNHRNEILSECKTEFEALEKNGV